MKRMVKVLMGSIIALFVILVAIIVSYFVVENNGKEKIVSDEIPVGQQYNLEEEHIKIDEKTGIEYVDNILMIMFCSWVSEDRQNEIIEDINGKIVGNIDKTTKQIEISNKELEELEDYCTYLEEEYEEISIVINDVLIDIDDNNSNSENNKKGTQRLNPADVRPDMLSINDPSDKKEYQKRGLNCANWWLNAIQANEAWEYNERFNNIKIGIVDGGFDTGHEDLKISFSNEVNKAINNKDDHGTHVTGIIGATANNGKGIAGIVWDKELVCYDWDWRITKEQKKSTLNSILVGLIENVHSGAKVVNFSMGFSGVLETNNNNFNKDDLDKNAYKTSKIMVSLISEGYDFLVVQSAGNGASDDIGVNAINNGLFASITKDNCFKANKITSSDILNRIILVANAEQLSNTYQITKDSNGGSQVDVAAPGQNIYSTITGGFTGSYKYLSGTSMAAPMVTGVASLVWSVNENFTGPEVKEIVCNNYSEWVASNPNSPNAKSDKINIKDGKEIYGYPMVNAKLAVEEAIRRTDNDTLIGVVEEETKSENQIEINDGKSITLSGTLSFEDYEINSNNKGSALILTIEEPFIASFESGYTELITSVELSFDDYSKFAKGQYITVTGKIMIAHTGHHRRSIVLTDIENNINIDNQSVSIVLQNYDMWSDILNSEFSNILESQIGFLDIDFDGELEFLATNIQGAGFYSHLKCFDIDINNQELIEVENNSNIDIIGEGLELYKDKNNCYFYLGKDEERISVDNIYYTTCSLKYENNKLVMMYLYADNIIEGTKKFYKFNDTKETEISSDEYEKIVNTFYEENDNLNLIYYLIRNFNDLDEEEKMKELLESYNHFTYDGFKN